ncbi:glycosyltransferase family 2 protein [Methanosarcina sp. 2.H.A.1B.4]|uniref:glycosyltransferase family 2 protein n=1 Tax=Methanosarcina sp. 2.H.A.1B.4 TaxID=1483600 RepID=UPI000621569C|nr:glycosyltransferase family 2 protein [Methanosarcina sp. 2.H.A.1B.4]KKG07379.1 glycosyl transferase family 2 [Methanosarcina sp. 2.H.A.1B.4]
MVVSSKKPLVSIVTSCMNSAGVLEGTILSVINQKYPNIEYIIIDGNSTDGTLDIIKKYENKIAKWVSEPDSGVYDGMNKGIARSTGNILYFLNAGDYLYNDEIVDKVVEKFLDESVVAVYGNVEVINDFRKKRIVRGCRVTSYKLLFRHICHQTLFVRGHLFDEIGSFSYSFKLAADHEFIIKAIKKYPDNFLYMDEILAKYRDGGMSCKMMDRMKLEELRILSDNYNVLQFLAGVLVCIVVVMKYKVPQLLKMKSARFE